MKIYEHRDSVATNSGETSTTTLKIIGGLCSQFLVVANTATTVFRCSLVDDKSVSRLNYGFHRGEINDIGCNLPMQGTYTLNITNASPNDVFTIVLAVRED